MKLHEAIAYSIEREGEDIITRPLLVNYLADLQAYDTPAVKRIVETIVDEGYGERLLNCSSSDDFELQVNDVVAQMVRYEGYQQDLVEYVMNCISYALGKTDVEPLSATQPISSQTTSAQNKRRSNTRQQKVRLNFVQTGNDYQTELNGNVYVLNVEDYKAMIRKKDMSSDRLEIWLKAYTEQAKWHLVLDKEDYKHAKYDISNYHALFKENGIVMTVLARLDAKKKERETKEKKYRQSDTQLNNIAQLNSYVNNVIQQAHDVLQQRRLKEERTARLWTALYRQCNGVISLNDLERTIAAYKREWEGSLTTKGVFYTQPLPREEDIKKEVTSTLDKEYDINTLQEALNTEEASLNAMIFKDEEPTLDSIEAKLEEEAEQKVKSLLPWKRSKLRHEYVEQRLDNAVKGAHSAWEKKKSDFESKREVQQNVVYRQKENLDKLCEERENAIQSKTKTLYYERLDEWKKKRDGFFKSEIERLQGGIDGDKSYVEYSIGTAFDGFWHIDYDLNENMKFFVDFTFDEGNGKVYVDLDLPKIEDTPTKQREDYANCVFGLSMYVADTIFNQSIKIEKVEIAGHTQRMANNSALITDQYLFVVEYVRELFDRIDFNCFKPIQIVDFFPHCKSMTPTYLLREINLATAYSRIEACEPVNYEYYIEMHPLEPLKEEQEDNIDANEYDINTSDPLLEEAAIALISAGIGSTSVIQRKLSIGYNRANRIMDQLENLGIVSHAQGYKPRNILIKDKKVVHILTNN